MSITTLVDKKRVFVAMSGGVDSSVAALLLKKQGYDVTGIYIKGFNLDGCGEKDAEDARRVSEKLAIPFYVFDFEKEYKSKVVDYMIKGYKSGITPNPDVMCNKEIKFGLFLKKALAMAADYIATGHYVRLQREFPILNSQFLNKSKIKKLENCKLKIAKDKNKDQSYFLWKLTQERLQRCLFPIGDYLKSKVRIMAKKAGLLTADKKDSQGICFLGKISLKDFLKKYIAPKKGLICTIDNKVIGQHDGSFYYTIGQRHGLGLSGKAPYYIVDKDIKKNIIYVAEGDADKSHTRELLLGNINIINPEFKALLCGLSQNVSVRTRYRQPLVAAKLIYRPSKFASGSSMASISFDRPQKFVAPGQSAVFYNKKGEMLGGGEITRIR